LNDAYRGQNKPTNVLSFPADISLPAGDGVPEAAGRAEKTNEIKILGDIVICAPVVRREAQDQEKSVHDHCTHMVVHGMLHLYGHDHVDPAEADVMEDLEREILGGFGIADPYGSD
jgi:probable rRNA maturation factor